MTRTLILAVAALATVLPAVSNAFVIAPAFQRYHTQVLRAHRPNRALPQLTARFIGDSSHSLDNTDSAVGKLSRKDVMWLLAAGSASLLAPMRSVEAATQTEAPVVVIGAGGGTGGDTVRALLSSKIPVVASTRRPMKIAIRDRLIAEGMGEKPLSMDTLLLNAGKDEKGLRRVIADVVKPETLPDALQGARAVIFCAGTRPKVDVTTTPGTNLGDSAAPQTRSASFFESNLAASKGNAVATAQAEDVGLVNVAKECLRQGIPKLIIVSSICAKCQRGDGSQTGAGEQIDRGTASCDTCYRKQDGEAAVRNLYASAPAGMSYTIVRPGLLSRGEKRGPSQVEFNQGSGKSGIIGREDLAEVLVAAAGSNSGARKTFEVYYSDTAQPVDIVASLKSCQGQGKSVKECFFGKGYDTKSAINLDEVLSKPLEGSLFASGAEVQGKSYPEMFSRLSADVQEPFDLNQLSSPAIL